MQWIMAGEDIYANFIAGVLGIDPAAVVDDQRHQGKTGQLSCQYGVGWKQVQRSLRQFGVIVTDDQAQMIVNTFRRVMHSEVPQAWRWFEQLFMKQINRHPSARTSELNTKVNIPGQMATDCDPKTIEWIWPSGRRLRFQNLKYRG